MTKLISRRLLLGGMSSLVAFGAQAEAPLTSPRPAPRTPLQAATAVRAAIADADQLMEAAQLGGKVGFAVANARTGQVLEAHNPLLKMPPASVAKAVTAVYGLETLGGGYRFRTQLIATGPVVGGEIKGDLVLAGGGDPVMDTDDLADLAARLKAAGVTAVSGKFKVYAGALPYHRVIDRSQPDHLGYNPAVSGLNLNFNRVYFQWKRGASGYDVTMDARSEKYRPQVAIARMRVVDREAPVYTYRQDGNIDNWTVARGALGKEGSRWLPVRRPDLYAAEVFQSFARAQGIRLSTAVPVRSMPGGTVVAALDSAELKTITRLMLKYSTNLTAEVIGLTASTARGRSPKSLEASARAMNSWMKQTLGTKHAKLVDHSGLNDRSRLSASDMIKVLVRTGSTGQLHGLMKEVVPLDAAGDRNPNAGYSIQAKTGSLNFVSSLAGYIQPNTGSPLVFTIFTGDLKRRAGISRDDRERPEGARGWARRSRRLQHQLISRWAAKYGSAP